MKNNASPATRRTKAELGADDLLLAIFANFPQQEFRAYDTTDIITAIYKSSKKSNYTHFFKNCVFDTDGLDPDCKELSSALDTLQHSSLLGRMNPYLTNYKVAPEVKTYYMRKIAPLCNDQDAVKALATDVFNHLKTLSPVNATA